MDPTRADKTANRDGLALGSSRTPCFNTSAGPIAFSANWSRIDPAPNPRRLALYLKLKGIVLETQQVDMMVAEQLTDAYRAVNLPLMKYYAILTTNTRIIILSVCVLIDVPWLYFAAEVVGINAVMLLVILRQEKISARLIHEIDARKVPA